MNRQFFVWYQYIAPALLTPLSFWLWWQTYAGDIRLVLVAWLLPILYAYIVPAVGTNILKVWEFDTRFRLGRFRPQHGFVFGSATAMLAWLGHFGPAVSALDLVGYVFVMASVLGLWNILYDIKALRSGILKVYNQPFADGRGAEAITLDYAPWFFAGFGAVYGGAIAGAEILVSMVTIDSLWFSGYFIAVFSLSIAVPVLGYRHHSFKTHGHSGCKPVGRPD